MQVKYHEMETKKEPFLVKQILLLWNGHSDARPRDPAVAAGTYLEREVQKYQIRKWWKESKKAKDVLGVLRRLVFVYKWCTFTQSIRL